MGSRHTEVELILQQCLDSILSGKETVDRALARYPDLADELRPRLEAAIWLQTKSSVLDVRPGFVSASRQRLLDRIQEEQAARPPVSPWSRFLEAWQSIFVSRRLVYQLALVFVIFVSLVASATGAGIASQDAIPGDSLYGVKLGLESVRLAVTFDEADKADLYIAYAQRRLVEIQTLILENRLSYIAATVSRFESYVEQAVLALEVVASQDSGRAKELATTLQETLTQQHLLLNVLAKAAPAEILLEIDRATQIADAGLLAMQSIATQAGIDLGLTPTPTATGTPVFSSLTTPTAALGVPTITPQPSPSPTVFDLATATPSGTLASPTGTLPVAETAFVITPTPTGQSTTVIKATITPTPTVNPEITKTPSVVKTKKPAPEPTRRPPKPTKKP